VAVDGDGTLYFSDTGHHRIRAVGRDGLLKQLAGTGSLLTPFVDRNPAASGALNLPLSLAVAPDRSLLVAGNNTVRIQRVGSPMPGFPASDVSIASKDGTELYVFDVRGRHLRTMDTLTGNVIRSFAYDPDGHLTGITDRDGNVTTITRLADGTPTAIVAPGGQTTTLSTFPSGVFAAITNPAGESVQFTYKNGGSLLETLRTPRGFFYTFTYDFLGRLQRDDDPADGFKKLTPSETFFASIVDVETAEDRTTRYATQGSLDTVVLRTITEPTGLNHVLTAAPDGSAEHVRPNGHLTRLQTSADPRFGMQAPVPASLIDRQTLTLERQVQEIRDPPTLIAGNPLNISSATTRFIVGAAEYKRTYTGGSTRTIVDRTPVGRTRTTTLDAKGRVASVAVSGLAPVTFTREPTGLITSITEGTGGTARTTTLDYDANRRLSSITDPLSSIVDPLLRTVTFGYDLADRITSQTFPDGRVVGFRYDESGNVKKVLPPGAPPPEHEFFYTAVDLDQRYAPPGIGLFEHDTQYSYNLDRQLTGITRPDGQNVTFTYESTGGRLATRAANGETVTFGYDPVGGELTSLDSTGDIDLTLGYAGSLLTSVMSEGDVRGTTGTTYDSLFRVNGTTVSVPGSPATYPIAFGYDNDSLLTQAGALTLGRHPEHGMVSGTTLGSVSDERDYTTFGEIQTYTATVSGVDVFTRDYGTPDPLGRIATLTETIADTPLPTTVTTSFTYDVRNRLETVTRGNGPTVRYTYDDNGNRETREVGGFVVESATYDAQDRLQEYVSNGIPTTYSYTASGQLASKTIGSNLDVTEYDYDALGNLRHVTLHAGTPSAEVITYIVDPLNRRVAKEVGGVRHGFLYEDQLRIAAELDGANRVVRRFVYGTGTNVPEHMITYDTSGQQTGIYRLLTDHLGSVRLVVDTRPDPVPNRIVQRMEYDEFGRVLVDTNPGFQPFGFAGGLYDRDTGLVRFGARDYDAVTGRWTAKDPIGFRGGMNVYAYTSNRPIDRRDSTGLFFEEAVENFVVTNSAIPGLTVPIGSGLFTAGYTAEAVQGVTLGKWALGGFRGQVMGAATFTSLETFLTGLGVSALHWTLTGIAWEGGVAVGSAIGAIPVYGTGCTVNDWWVDFWLQQFGPPR
jgi:RHS repeat-associated protein